MNVFCTLRKHVCVIQLKWHKILCLKLMISKMGVRSWLIICSLRSQTDYWQNVFPYLLCSKGIPQNYTCRINKVMIIELYMVKSAWKLTVLLFISIKLLIKWPATKLASSYSPTHDTHIYISVSSF